MNATTDLTQIYKGSLSKAKRGIAIADKKYVVVRDEIETLPGETTVRWTLLTPTEVKITGTNKAELIKNGKKLILQVQEPANVVIKTWPTDPPHSYDAPNPGTTLVGFEITLPPNVERTITVTLVPQSAEKDVKKKMLALSKWN